MRPNSAPPVDFSLVGAPVVGEAIQVEASRAGHPVAGQPLVEVRPAGAVDAAQRTAGTTDTTGRVTWTPDRAGFVSLEIGETGRAAVVAPGPVERLSGGLVLGALALTLVAGQLWLRRRERA